MSRKPEHTHSRSAKTVSEVIADLPETLRSELKEPFGPIFTDTDALLDVAGSPLLCVGDVVTHHIIEAGHTPAVALVDERTERSAVDDEIAATLAAFDGFDRTVQVSNPAATLTTTLLAELTAAIERADDTTTLIEVDGEEDLATLPAVVVAPDEASIVYGQPGEGMVHVSVDDIARTECRNLLVRMDGDERRLWTTLGVDS